MSLVDGSGTAHGAATVSGTGRYLAGGSGTASGIATFEGQGGVLLIFTGVSHGLGDLFWRQFVDGSGTAAGLGSISGASVRVRTASGRFLARGDLLWSYPLPMHGKSALVGFPVVERIRTLIKAICPGPKAFRYMDLLQRGDLPVFISDHDGPVSPVKVSYTLYLTRPDGSYKQVGPAHMPSKGVVGEYYATGRAGELGQPGEWFIRWEYQRTYQSAPQFKEMRFRVLDAVLAKDPRDVTPRCRKFGWN
jgi:hypothetical protein